MIEKLEVKGEAMPEIMGACSSEIFVGDPEVSVPPGGMEHIASVSLPGQCWHLINRRFSDLPGDVPPIASAAGLRLEIEISNRTDCESEIVIMANSEARNRVRLFIVQVPPDMVYRINLEPLRQYDDLHLVSWQAFDAALVMEHPDDGRQRIPLSVRSPVEGNGCASSYASYCQERYTYKRFSGSYLFGYFEKTLNGREAGMVCLHVLWPNHGELLHVRYLCDAGIEARGAHPLRSLELPEPMRSAFGDLAEKDEMAVVLISDMEQGPRKPTGYARVSEHMTSEA